MKRFIPMAAIFSVLASAGCGGSGGSPGSVGGSSSMAGTLNKQLQEHGFELLNNGGGPPFPIGPSAVKSEGFTVKCYIVGKADLAGNKGDAFRCIVYRKSSGGEEGKLGCYSLVGGNPYKFASSQVVTSNGKHPDCGFDLRITP